jgi:hypothetical protein
MAQHCGNHLNGANPTWGKLCYWLNFYSLRDKGGYLMAAYNLIATTTVGSGGASTISFASIPQTFTDLKVVLSARSTAGASVAYSIFMKMNNLTTSIYSQKALEGSGSGGACSSFAQSGVDTTVRAGITNGTGSTASVFSSTEIYIPNYTGSNQKSVSIETVTETNANTIYANLIAYLVASTAAITDLTFSTEPLGAVSFAQYSSASIYGIKNS